MTAQATSCAGSTSNVAQGEFLTLLGPSGSGKTTTLMMLAGFEAPTHGTITLDGKRIDSVPPHRRNIGVVFQNYALFPHMTVGENVAFPLKMRRLPRREVDGARAPRARHGAHGELRDAAAGPAFGRPAAAHRAGPRAGVRAASWC